MWKGIENCQKMVSFFAHHFLSGQLGVLRDVENNDLPLIQKTFLWMDPRFYDFLSPYVAVVL